MWFILKSMISMLCMVMLAYAVFFVDLHGKTFAAHVLEVWRSPIVQKKLGLLQDGLDNKLNHSLKAVAKHSVQHLRQQQNTAQRDDDVNERTSRRRTPDKEDRNSNDDEGSYGLLTDDDREDLEFLLNKIDPAILKEAVARANRKRE